MARYLIKDTTEEERRKIVEDSLGDLTDCDGCMDGLAEMYEEYIARKKEIREITMEFHARYVNDMEEQERGGSCIQF